MTRPNAAVLLLCLIPPAVPAGEIPWSYSTTFSQAGDPDVPYAYVGLGGTGFEGTYALAVRLAGIDTSALAAGTIAAGQASAVEYNAASESPPTGVREFALGFHVTDCATGRSGDLTYFGRFDQQSSDGPIYLSVGGPTYRSLVIDGCTFGVCVPCQWLSDARPVEAFVTAETPEPATLTLVALGAALFVVWRVAPLNRRCSGERRG